MRKISFSQLMCEGVNVTRIAAVERRWRNGNVNRYPSGRGQNIISYTISGKKHICTGDEGQEICSLTAPAAVLIARGAPYISRTELTEEEYGHTICVRFAMTDDMGEELQLEEPYRYWENDPDGRLLHLFRGILAAYLAPGTPRLLLKARLLELLHELAGAREGAHIPPDFHTILPAIRYIEKHPAENTTVPELAAMCFLSESYFRARFRAFAGCSPTDYRNRLRVAKAKELLQSSLWTTDLIAETLGFYDTSHFYRVYKRITGQTPRGE
ncbi:MAG: helix-turn-helix transcriptional regulator [Clostridia bacterium]|nr:helix-turn-helix transcriptional regulator [Clostridia bacterium]